MRTNQIKSFIDSVYAERYYVEILEKLCDPTTLHERADANEVLEEFWYRLPDNKSIRTPVFFKLCDLIESIASEY